MWLLGIRNSIRRCFGTGPEEVPLVRTVRRLLDQGQDHQEHLYQVHGWVRGRVQRKKWNHFVQLDDGSSFDRLQVVVPNRLLDEIGQPIHNGAALQCVGRVQPSPGRLQPVELHCQRLTVLGSCPPDQYQLGHLKTGLELDLLRERVHLRPRVRYFQSVLRVRDQLCQAIGRFMAEHDFFIVHPPLITGNDCEGGGQCFGLWPAARGSESAEHLKHYFGRPAYLTVSGQLHLEALAASLSRVYTLSPVFRAEKSMSPKHLSEFLMLELEQAFLFELEPLMELVEALVRDLIGSLEQHCPKDLHYLVETNGHRPFLDRIKAAEPFPRIRYEEACALLADQYPQLVDGPTRLDLNAQMERSLLERLDHRPVFVTDYPSQLKPFYMRCESGIALCFDLITPVCGELCGGSLREHRTDRLLDQIGARGLAAEPLAWYLELRRFGGAASGGFGLGLDRLIQTITGVANIKDAIPFPRWPHHCYL